MFLANYVCGAWASAGQKGLYNTKITKWSVDSFWDVVKKRFGFYTASGPRRRSDVRAHPRSDEHEHKEKKRVEIEVGKWRRRGRGVVPPGA